MPERPAAVRVLLVEDHPDVAEVTLLMLRHLGAEPVHAATAAEGIKLAGSQAFDLLLADMRLPDGTGLDVIRHCAACDGGPRPRPVLLTAYGATDALSGAEGLVFERMTKPVEMDRLQALLDELGAEKV